MRGGPIAAIVMAVVLLVIATPVRATTTDVTVYAHRGGAGLAPENTLGAFRHAAAQFGDRGVWLELDTQLTADGHRRSDHHLLGRGQRLHPRRVGAVRRLGVVPGVAVVRADPGAP